MRKRYLGVIMSASLAGLAGLAGLAFLAAISLDAGCGKRELSQVRPVPLSTMHSGTPLYVMEGAGRLIKLDLNSGKTTILSDHGFHSAPTLRASADGRWLSYSGELKTGNKQQYWLFDRSNNSERLVYEHPAWGGGIPAFSPDGRYLAIGANYDSRWDSASRAGLFVFDTATARLISVKLPVTMSVKETWASPAWSQDGETLLILARDMSGDAGFIYLGFHPASGHIDKLSGQYDSQAYRHDFKRGATVIPVADDSVPRSEIAHESAWSPGGQWHAYFDQRQDSQPYRLVIADKAGVVKPVAVGHYNQCEGYTLDITGWLDERHLVYRSGMMRFYVFDTATGTTAHLAGDDDTLVSFTW